MKSQPTACVHHGMDNNDKWFRVTLGGSDDPHPEIWEGSLDDLAAGNEDTPEVAENADALSVGEKYEGGGGAAPVYTIERLS